MTTTPVATRTETFLDLKDYPELSNLSGKVAEFRQELEQTNAWMEWQSDSTDDTGHCTFLSGDWTVSPVYFGNWGPEDLQKSETAEERARMAKMVAALPQAFPKINAALAEVPYINFAAFARLHPRSKLDTHTHNNPLSVTCHMGLRVPPPGTSGLHCGDDKHLWNEPGEVIIFDDNLPHGAWNDSDEERVILHMSIRRDKSGRTVKR